MLGSIWRPSRVDGTSGPKLSACLVLSPANPSPKLPMSELVPSEIIEKLEQRHEHLIAELDELNERLEKALNSFVKPSADEPSVDGPTIDENKEIRLKKADKMTKSEA